LLKGPEKDMADGQFILDKMGIKRYRERVKWWLDVKPSEPPIFFGHYWFSGEPAPVTENSACLDYSIGLNGKLVAYRWDYEKTLSKQKFVAIVSQK